MKRFVLFLAVFLALFISGNFALTTEALAFYEARQSSDGIDLYYQSKIAVNDSYRLRAVYTAPINEKPGDYSIRWTWVICGKTYNLPDYDNDKYSEYTYKFSNVSTCTIKVKANFVSNPTLNSLSYSNSKNVQSEVRVLPVYSNPITIEGAPQTIRKAETFWMSSSYPGDYENIKWDWSSTGACKGAHTNYDSSTKIGEKGDKTGNCYVNLSLDVYKADRVLRGNIQKVVKVIN